MQGVSSLVVPMLFAVAINRQYPEREGAGLKVKKKKKWGGGGGGGACIILTLREVTSLLT